MTLIPVDDNGISLVMPRGWETHDDVKSALQSAYRSFSWPIPRLAAAELGAPKKDLIVIWPGNRRFRERRTNSASYCGDIARHPARVIRVAADPLAVELAPWLLWARDQTSLWRIESLTGLPVLTVAHETQFRRRIVSRGRAKMIVYPGPQMNLAPLIISQTSRVTNVTRLVN